MLITEEGGEGLLIKEDQTYWKRLARDRGDRRSFSVAMD